MLRVGLVGAGGFAEKDLAALRALSGRIQVVCAARRHTARPFGTAPEIPVMAFQALLEESALDAIVISSPNHLHREHAKAALDAGKHVFCEKPMALSLKDAEELAQAAERANRILMVGHLTRHTPAYAVAASIVQAGRLGRVHAFQAARWQTSAKASGWRMRPEQGGGAPFDLLLHDFDLVQWLCGVPKRVVAAGQRHPAGAYERFSAAFLCPNEVLATVDGGFSLPEGTPMFSSLRVIGAEGMLTVELPSKAPVCLKINGAERESIPVHPPQEGVDGLRAEFIEFLDTIERRPWRRLLLDDAYRAVAMTAAALEAAESGRAVEIRPIRTTE